VVSVNEELHFETRGIRSVSEDMSDINGLLKKYAERLEEINIHGAIFHDISENNPSKQISKALSRSVDSVKKFSKDLSDLEKALVDTAYIYDKAENEIGRLFSNPFLPNAVGLIPEKNERKQNYQENFAFGHFGNIETGHISSNELILPGWLMDAVAKFNTYSEEAFK